MLRWRYQHSGSTPAPVVQAYEDIVVATTPVAYYPMDEASGSLVDVIGGLNMTVTGSPTYQATGPTLMGTVQKAITWSGTGQHANASTDPGVTSADQSFMIWGQWTALAGTVHNLCSRFTTDPNASWRFFAVNTGEARFLTQQNATTTHGEANTSGQAYEDSVWRGFIGTFDGGVAMDLYDSDDPTTPVASDVAFAGVWNNAPAASPLRIANQSGGTNLFAGSLCHFAFWDRLLTGTEIQDLLAP
jgi:hypothetical protein